MFSQETWTLDDCVSYALEHNLQLNDFKYNTESSRETYRQSFRNLLPSVTAFSDYGIRFGRSVDPNDNSISDTEFFTNTYSLEASLDLFQGFQKLNGIKASKFIYKATEEETLQQKFLLAFRVMQAFYDIQFFEGSLTIAKEQESISQTNYDLVKKQIELGLMAGADLYEAESILLTDKLSVTQADNQLKAAKLILTQEMNLKGTIDISVEVNTSKEITNPETFEIRSDSIFDKAKDFMPIIKAGKFREEAAKKQLAVERGKLYPTLSLFTGYGTGYYETITDSLGVIIPYRDQFRDNSFQFIGLSLSIPISNGWSSRSSIKQQKIAQLRAENDLAIQEQELYETIQDIVQQYEALQIEYIQTKKAMESQSLAFTIAQKRYEKGLINSIDLFTTKNLFATAQNQNLMVRLSLEVNKSTLDFYRGLPVFNMDANASVK
ncbi:TolC family protein [Aquimarina addita]|uniref:TolC family protein n=1 Tax=Aquimarina addita TaxID=870485 RepID=A0ABP7XGD3_9FLAO